MPKRPPILEPLFKPMQFVKGIGPKLLPLYEKLCGGEAVIDLLQHLPIDYIDRTVAGSIKAAPDGVPVSLTVTVDSHQPPNRYGQPYKILCSDESGFLYLIFFKPRKAYLTQTYEVGKTITVSGKVEKYGAQSQMIHPSISKEAPEVKDGGDEVFEAVYPLTAGLTNKHLRNAVHNALESAPDLPEWLDAALKERESWPDWKAAMTDVHNPDSQKDLDAHHPTRERLAYDELLASQLALMVLRQRQVKAAGQSFQPPGALKKNIYAALPFTLTGAQARTLKDIEEDLRSSDRMLRLIQGDVGSGKTIVAALAMADVVECGAQAALMAPTEILARQHAHSLKPYLDAAGIRYVTLTGRDKGKDRQALEAQIESGAAQVVIGTHALFQDKIKFHNLGLAVVDEQHRFGVHQRLMLSDKGRGVNVLVMTATPIPRTLALTAYGDMAVSKIDEKPPGRKPIETLLLSNDKMDTLIQRLQTKLAEGARVYWVCPLVEDSEVLDLSAAEDRHAMLQGIFGERVGLIHGRMKPEYKDKVMNEFASGTLNMLVATTVIEVGVNVPEATIMVIEDAQRFGLAQLHQLRGRVGRGQEHSYCFLLYRAPLNEFSRERLEVMRQTEDGFVIAERDLKLRGAGEILGTRQSGLPNFRLADLSEHYELLEIAHDDARLILDKDSELKTARGEALRTLLYLFKQDKSVQYLRSG